MRITLVTNTDSHAIDYYRGLLPLSKAAEQGKCELKNLLTRDLILDARLNPKSLEYDLTADYIVVRGNFTRPKLKAIREIHKLMGSPAKIIYDYDDDPFHVSPLNKSYAESGTQEISLTLPSGEVVPFWVDGKNIDITENKLKMSQLKEALAEGDMITTTTPILADVLRQCNPNVKILPNCIDVPKFKKLDLPKREVRVLWTGSASHYEDLLEIKPVVEGMLERFPNVKFVVCGYAPPGMMKSLPSDRVEFHDWDHVQAYPYKLSMLNADIALIPLRNTQFNNCKSPLKFLEMSALSIPSIVSFVSPYKELIEKAGTDGIGLFVEDFEPEVWLKALEMLIESPDLREGMALKAKTFIENNFDINKRCGDWPKAYMASSLVEVA